MNLSGKEVEGSNLSLPLMMRVFSKFGTFI